MLKDLLENHKYLIFAGISTFSLIFTSVSILSISKSVNRLSSSIDPISEWAETQNDCITRTFRIDGKNTQGLPEKVWSCNGGGD